MAFLNERFLLVDFLKLTFSIGWPGDPFDFLSNVPSFLRNLPSCSLFRQFYRKYADFEIKFLTLNQLIIINVQGQLRILIKRKLIYYFTYKKQVERCLNLPLKICLKIYYSSPFFVNISPKQGFNSYLIKILLPGAPSVVKEHNKYNCL